MKKTQNKTKIFKWLKEMLQILRTQLHVGFAHRDCDINVKLNQKVPIVFHNLKNYDSHLICKYKTNTILKWMSYLRVQKNTWALTWIIS